MKETKFKHTVIGGIPVDWDITSIEDIAIKVGSGKTPLGGDSVYSVSGHPFVRSQNVGRGYFMLDDIAYISSTIHQSQLSSELRINDVLLNITGASIGRSAVVDKRLVGGNVNQHVCIIRLKQDIYSPLFLCYGILSSFGQKQIAAVQSGGSREGLNFKNIRAFIVPKPTFTEQSHIAKALTDIDDLIEITEALLKKKQGIKQGAMDELLTGKRRLDGFREPWMQTAIGVLADIVTGATPNTQNKDFWIGGTIPWMNSGEINLKHVYQVEGKITESGYESTSTHLIPPFCVLIALAGQGKTRGTCAINHISLCTNQSIAAIQPNENYCSMFLYYLLDSKYYQLRSASSGDSSRGGLTKRQLSEFPIFIPSSIDEQETISNILTGMDAEIVNLEANLHKYKALKQGMMEQLLTGKIRLL